MFKLKSNLVYLFIAFFGLFVMIVCFVSWEALSQEVERHVFIKKQKTPLKESIGGKTIAELKFSTPVSMSMPILPTSLHPPRKRISIIKPA